MPIAAAVGVAFFADCLHQPAVCDGLHRHPTPRPSSQQGEASRAHTLRPQAEMLVSGGTEGSDGGLSGGAGHECARGGLVVPGLKYPLAEEEEV